MRQTVDISQNLQAAPANGVRPVETSTSVEIQLPDGRRFEGPRGTPIGKILELIAAELPAPIMGAVINTQLRELTYPIEIEAKVRPVTMAEADGARIYRRSLIFLLEAAFTDLYPASSLAIDHSISSGGFYLPGGRPPDSWGRRTCAPWKAYEELVEADLPFERQIVPLREAIALFPVQAPVIEKVRLLALPHRKTPGAVSPGRAAGLPPRLYGAFHRFFEDGLLSRRWEKGLSCGSRAARRQTKLLPMPRFERSCWRHFASTAIGWPPGDRKCRAH